jgi:hypothetical protein
MVCVAVAYKIKLKRDYNNEVFSAERKINIYVYIKLYYFVRRINSTV